MAETVKVTLATEWEGHDAGKTITVSARDGSNLIHSGWARPADKPARTQRTPSPRKKANKPAPSTPPATADNPEESA